MSETYIGNKPAGAKDIIDQLPIGSIVAWPSATLPLGWIECNGQVTTPYPDLALIVGATVPDLRGEFIRGYDNNRGVDPGRVLKSAQADEFKVHSHIIQSRNVYDTTGGGKAFSGGGGTLVDSSEATGGAETRPKNIALIYIIKAFNVIKENGAVNHYIGKNYLINSNFQINQRAYVNGTASVGARQYTRDRWFLQSSGNSVIFANNIATITGILGQAIEDFGYRGQWTLSWEGTAQAYTYSNGQDPGTVPRTSPTTFTGSDDVQLFFEGGTIENVKLEVGAGASPYEPPDPGSEIVRCERYYQIKDFPSFVPISGAWRSGSGGTIMESPMFFRDTTMRTTPAFSASTFNACDHVRTVDAVNAGSVVPYLNYNDQDRWNFRSNITGINANFYNVVPTGGAINLIFDAEL